MSILKVNTIQDKGGNAIITSDGSGTLTLGNDALKATPSFYAYRTSGQDISNTTNTKIQMDVELYDSDSAYDNSTNYRFTVPTGKGGKYFLGAYCRITNFTSNRRLIYLYKNNSTTLMQGEYGNDGPYQTLQASTIADLSAGDYVELYGYQDSGATKTFASGGLYQTGFFGYKLIGA